MKDSICDMFVIRDVISRYEELEDITRDSEEQEEFEEIASFLAEVKGRGGDEQWRGDWYPISFISEDYFTEYAEELIKDINDIPSYIEIDWEATADNIKVDYHSVIVEGEKYFYR